ncbi:hypothetical protein RB213_012126 [Colletotrichum asianum]
MAVYNDEVENALTKFVKCTLAWGISKADEVDEVDATSAPDILCLLDGRYDPIDDLGAGVLCCTPRREPLLGDGCAFGLSLGLQPPESLMARGEH